MRERIIAGNWKMNTCLQDGVLLARNIKEELKQQPAKGSTVILFPPATHLLPVHNEVSISRIKTGGQDCSSQEKGAFTGEISAEMLISTGAQYVILGHSERRNYHREDSVLLLAKLKRAVNSGLRPIFCCGEQENERESGRQETVVSQQLETTLFQLEEKDLKNTVIAYEPVWAIGTGKTASPQQAQEMHAFIRSLIRQRFSRSLAEEIPLLYGGSCKPDNARELFALPDVDGGLIGGASLKASDFCQIIHAMDTP